MAEYDKKKYVEGDYIQLVDQAKDKILLAQSKRTQAENTKDWSEKLLEKGYVTKVADAFDKWIGRNGPAYVEREKMTPAECVQCIVERGGLACLAHPADLANLDALLDELKAAGMAAMEVFYKDYSPETVERLRQAAEAHGLMPLGGSDYHGIFGNNEPLPGNIPLTRDLLRMLELGDNVASDDGAVRTFQLPLLALDDQLRRAA